jgi:SP family sugar:H+ symporter-like MFS transporter
VASIQLFIGIGGLIASLVNKAYSTHVTRDGWIVPVCIQAIWPVLLVIGLPFVPLSPRWLISKRRHRDATRSLRVVRPKLELDSGACEAEIDAIENALQNHVDKGSWMELFQGTNLRRTSIATVVFTLQVSWHWLPC